MKQSREAMSPESGREGRGLHASMSTCKGGGRDRCKFFAIFDPSIDIAIIRIIANIIVIIAKS